MTNYLANFLTLNPSINSENEDDNFLILRNLWNDESVGCKLKNSKTLTKLSKIYLPEEMSAIFHSNIGKLEVIYSILPKDYELLNRSFEVNFQGSTFKCYFGKPSNEFKTIATGFKESDDIRGETYYRNLRIFRDYYNNAQSYLKKFFNQKIPINFFIEGDFSSIENNFCLLAKHINFYSHYFDRKTPILLIFSGKKEKRTFNQPCMFNLKRQFPTIINSKILDPVLLDLFETARKSNSNRLKFIFYFQVLEYCSYYYLQSDLKRRLTNLIKNPDLINDAGKYSSILIEEFKDNFKQNDDSIKLEKLIIENCNFEDIELEIKENEEYFKETLSFDGGLIIDPLFSSIDKIEPKTLLKTIKTNIEKIRNTLVHLRESRENKIILTTEKNNELIIPYLYIVQRLAEKIAIIHD